MSQRIVFSGTPEFAVPSLKALCDSAFDVVAVLTQPDRPAGRGQSLRATPVKTLARLRGIPVYTPTSLKDPEVLHQLRELAPDVMVVVAYGLLLPKVVLDLPRLGCVNVHPSLLPRWRGAAPIQHTVLSGDVQTGVAIMKLDRGMDTGPILDILETPVHPLETSGELHDRLAQVGAEFLIDTLKGYFVGRIKPVAQSAEGATHAEKLTKSMAPLDWTRSAEALFHQVRGLNPWPMATMAFNGIVWRIWEAAVVEDRTNSDPGILVRISQEGIDVATGDGVLRLLKLQRPGSKPVTPQDFINAFHNRLLVGTTCFS